MHAHYAFFCAYAALCTYITCDALRQGCNPRTESPFKLRLLRTTVDWQLRSFLQRSASVPGLPAVFRSDLLTATCFVFRRSASACKTHRIVVLHCQRVSSRYSDIAMLQLSVYVAVVVTLLACTPSAQIIVNNIVPAPEEPAPSAVGTTSVHAACTGFLLASSTI